MILNGRLVLSSLVEVDGWAYLEARTAAAWKAGCDEMVRRGYARPSITAPDGAYRNLAGQQYWKSYWTNLHKPENAATPGWSNHGLGLSVDVYNIGQYPRPVVRRVFEAQGFSFNVPWENWHMTYVGTITAAAFTGAPIQGEEALSAAEVNQIQQMHDVTRTYLAGIIKGVGEEVKAVVRRESRMRLYQNKTTKEFMTADIATGRYEILAGQNEVDSLKYNGYLEIASEEIPQQVDQQRWDNIITKCPVNIKNIT